MSENKWVTFLEEDWDINVLSNMLKSGLGKTVYTSLNCL